MNDLFLGKYESLEHALAALGITMEQFDAVHKKLQDEKISNALGGRSQLEFITESWDQLREKTKREIVLILIWEQRH